MTRKDYIVIAEALRFALEHNGDAGALAVINAETGVSRRGGVMDAAEYIANAMKDDNPRFDQEFFLQVVRGERRVAGISGLGN